MRVTIDNAHQITLQRTFNYHSIAFKPFQTVLKIIRKLQNKRDIYTLREIYDEFNNGLHVQDILDRHRDLTLKSALYARAFYKANNPQKFKKRKLLKIKY